MTKNKQRNSRNKNVENIMTVSKQHKNTSILEGKEEEFDEMLEMKFLKNDHRITQKQ